MMNKKKRYLGMGLTVVGCLFLFDPFISVVDVIPDFIGYALIAAGLSRLRDIDERMAESRKWMIRLMLLSLVRVVSLALVFSMAQSELATALLLAGFALSVLDCIVLFPAWQNFITGWTYLGSRLGGEAVLAESRGRKGGNVTERLGRQTLTFLVVREALAVLPEFAALTAVTEDGYTGMNWYNYITLFREVAVVVSLVWGIVWLCRVFRYAARVKKDTAFFASLNEKYEIETGKISHVFAKRRLYAGTVCVALGVAASVDFHVDGMEILPNLITAVLFLVGAVILRPCVTKKIGATAVLAVLYMPASVVAWVARWKFETTSSPMAILRNPEAAEQFYAMCGNTLLSEVLFLASLGAILTLLYAVVKEHTGYEAVNKDDARVKESNRRLHRYLNRRLTVAYVITAIATVGRILCVVARPYVEGLQFKIGKMSLPPMNSLMYGADVVFHIIIAILFWTALTAIREETHAKYRLF